MGKVIAKTAFVGNIVCGEQVIRQLENAEPLFLYLNSSVNGKESQELKLEYCSSNIGSSSNSGVNNGK